MSTARGLKKLDTFYYEYGFISHRFIVAAVNDNGVFVTTGSWLKSSRIFFPFDKLDSDPSFMPYKPYSKLRWFLKM